MSSRSFCMPPSDPIHVKDLFTVSKIVSHNKTQDCYIHQINWEEDGPETRE
jgi:hypothetical protein